jgi:hypothetical protein
VQARRRMFLPLSSLLIDTTSRLPAPDLFNFNKTQQTQQHYVPHQSLESEFSSQCKVALFNITKDLRALRSNSKTQRTSQGSSPILFTSSFNFQMRTTSLRHLEPLVIMDAPNSTSASNFLSIHGKPRLQSDFLRLTFP